MPQNLLTLENISKFYTTGQTVVMGLNHISLSFAAGEFVAVTGESGSGKSTLAKVIAGILPYENGELTLNGKPTSHYGQSDWEHYRCSCISFISQSYDILPGCTVLKNVVSALILTGMDKAKAAEKAENILHQVELFDAKNRKAAKLSSGQKQRLSIARALAKPAPILIADEPTGNLDSENSAKVIELLAAAAKERLVIMITHDWDEAKLLATRHIIIRDGTVDSDIRLRTVAETCLTPKSDSASVSEPDPASASEPTPKPTPLPGLSRFTAALQISSRPVWAVIMFLFFALTAFGMFAFLGTFVTNLDDSPTRYYDNSAFQNGSATRIVAMRTDTEDMTQEDWDTLLNLPYVERLERYGFIADINYYYREDIDYFYHYKSSYDKDGKPDGNVIQNLTLGDTELFLQTIPYLSDYSTFLKAGRLPENMYEIVAVGDESLIGTVMPIYIHNKKTFTAGTYILFNATVVGVTDIGGHIYFDEELGRVMTAEFVGNNITFAPYYGNPEKDGYSMRIETENDDILEGRYLMSIGRYAYLQSAAANIDKTGDLTEIFKLMYSWTGIFPNYRDPGNYIALSPGAVHESTYNNYFMVKPEVFDCVTPDTCGNQVSLTISDYAYTDRVLSSIKKSGYLAISPYKMGTTKQDEGLAAERLRTLKICITAFLAVLALQILVLRAMFGMEIEEFRLLANLGLRCRTAKQSIVWQITAFTAAGLCLTAIAIAVCSLAKVERIIFILKHLPASYIAAIALIHFAASLLSAMWIRASIARQIYPFSLRHIDLKMDEEYD